MPQTNVKSNLPPGTAAPQHCTTEPMQERTASLPLKLQPLTARSLHAAASHHFSSICHHTIYEYVTATFNLLQSACQQCCIRAAKGLLVVPGFLLEQIFSSSTFHPLHLFLFDPITFTTYRFYPEENALLVAT
ncbi:hypothetical protein HN51_055541 [Arachis hypogaea]